MKNYKTKTSSGGSSVFFTAKNQVNGNQEVIRPPMSIPIEIPQKLTSEQLEARKKYICHIQTVNNRSFSELEEEEKELVTAFYYK